jgi:hypothetical protein
MGQDWGGRRQLNPDNCPKISGSQVRQHAKELNITVKRDGLGMWFYYSNNVWYTLGQTNYLALHCLERVESMIKEREENYDK